MPSSDSRGIIALRHRTPESLQHIYHIINNFNHQYRVLPRTHHIADTQFRSYELANSHLIDDGPMLRQIMKDCENDDIVYDVGANIGTYSLVLAQQIFEGRIFAFEPVSSTYRRLVANLSIGSENNTHSLNVALSSETSTDKIFTGKEDRFSTLSEVRAENVDVHDKVKIQKVCLDEIEIPMPDKIKIDTEGHELEVLQGATKLLNESRPTIYVEPHDGGNYDLADLIDFLHSQSYSVRKFNKFVMAYTE